MICVPTPPMCACYSGVPANVNHPFGQLLRKTAITMLAVMSFVCFIRAAEFGVPDLFLPSRFRAVRAGGRLCANERVLIPPSSKIEAKIMELGLLKIISDCEVDLVLALLTFSRTSETD